MSGVSDSFTGTIPKELFSLMCGKQLGSGSARQVYEFAQDPKYVVKFEVYSKSFQNIKEWELWQSVRDTDYAKWFAPCKDISPCGSILIQARTSHVEHERYPKRIPEFFTDTKFDNYGKIGKQFCCHDYGLSLIHEVGLSSKLYKPTWWSSEQPTPTL